MTPPPQRYESLDIIRGVAVMGILLMNIVSFALPEAAYLNPRAYGDHGLADEMTWAANFLLIDNKMRGLFSMLFGASMLLVFERAENRDGNGVKVHRNRMLWLLIFGLAHYFFIWNGDILALYAACGLVGMTLLLLDERGLRRVSLILLAIGFLVMVTSVIAMMWSQYHALLPGASADDLANYHEMLRSIGPEGAKEMAAEIAVNLGSYASITKDRILNQWDGPFSLFITFVPETLGLMGLGMLLMRNGFLTGDWPERSYLKAAAKAYALGFAGLIPLLWLIVARDYDPVTIVGIAVAWSMPFRLCVMIGHGALIMFGIKRFSQARILPWIAATGRTAFTNYLGTSLLMTTVFYGYGYGLFGQVSRSQAYLVVPPMWLLMLAWSKPWLTYFRYGPFEWLWRSLALGEMQPMRR